MFRANAFRGENDLGVSDQRIGGFYTYHYRLLLTAQQHHVECGEIDCKHLKSLPENVTLL